MNGVLNSLVGAGEWWWTYAAHATWQSALLGLAVLAAVALLRGRAAPLRYGLLLVALAKFAMPPMLSSPTGAFGWLAAGAAVPLETAASLETLVLPATPAPLAEDVAVSDAAASSAPATGSVAPAVPAPIALGPINSLLPESSGAPTAPVRVFAAPVGGTRPFPRKAGLLCLHALGSCAAALWLLRSWRHTALLARRCEVVNDGAMLDLFMRLAEQLRVRRPVCLLFAPDDSPPMVFGLFHPVVIVSRHVAERLPSADLAVILAHELAHVRRRDVPVIWLENLLLLTWWFNPVLWLLVRATRRTREDCCDDVVLDARIADNAAYCDSLLRAAAGATRRPRVALGFATYLHPMGRRLKRIMDATIARSPQLSLAGLATLVLLAAVGLPGIRYASVNAQEVDETKPAAPSIGPPQAGGRYYLYETFDDGDFTSNPAWAVHNEGTVRGSIKIHDGILEVVRIDNVEGRQNASDGGTGLVLSDLDWPVSDQTEVIFDGKPVFRDIIDGSGRSGRNHPVFVELTVLDGEGKDVLLRYAVNYDGAARDEDVGWFRQRGTDVAQGAWARDLRFRVRETCPDAQRIRSVGIFSNGWNYAGFFDNIRIADPNAPGGPVRQATPAAPPPAVRTAPAPPPSASFKDPELHGDIVFKGRYKHFSRGGEIHEPATMWVSAQPDGALTTFVQAPFLRGYTSATGNAQHRVVHYGSGTVGEAPSYIIEFGDGTAHMTRKGDNPERNRDRMPMPIPESAPFDPNQRPDPYAAAPIILAGLNLKPSETTELTMCDVDNTGNALSAYKVRFEHKGKEKVTVPAGTFDANHIVETQLTTGNTWFKKGAGHITDFWTLDNGVIVRILRHREPYELQLLDWEKPAVLPGLVEKGAPAQAAGAPAGNPAGRRGPTGNVLQFDGRDDYVTIPSVPQLDLTTNVTVSAWAQVEPDQGEAPVLFRGDTRVGQDPYVLGVERGQVWFRMDLADENGRDFRCQAAAPVDREWHYWTGVRDASAGRIYLYKDGQRVSEVPASGQVRCGTSAMGNDIGAIDHGAWGSWGFLRGAIDQLSVWNVARKPEEIEREYREGLKGDEPGLVALWTFDEDGQTVRDSSSYTLEASLGSTAQEDANDPRRVAVSEARPAQAPTAADAVEHEIAKHYAKAATEVQEYVRWTARNFGRGELWLPHSAFDALSPEEREKKVQYIAQVLESSDYGRHLCKVLAEARVLADPRLLAGVRKVAEYHREDSDYDCRPKWMAAAALGNIGKIEAAPTLIKLVDHGNQNTRTWARASLVRLTGQDLGADKQAWGKWWNESHEPKLTEQDLAPWKAPHSEPPQPSASASAAPQAKTPLQAEDATLTAFHNPPARASDSIEEASRGVRKNVERLDADEPVARREAARKLGELNDRVAVEPLIDVLRKDPDFWVREQAAETLGKLGAVEAGPALAAAAKDEERRVRLASLRALMRLKPPQAAPTFEAALRDEAPDVQQSAAAGLKALGWQPSTEAQALWYAAAGQRWSELDSLYTKIRPAKAAATPSSHEAPLEYDVPVPIRMAANVDRDTVIEGHWIAFSKSDRVRARLFYQEFTMANSRWRIAVRLLDDSGQTLVQAQQDVSTQHLALGAPLQMDHVISFDLGTAAEAEHAARFVVDWESLAPATRFQPGESVSGWHPQFFGRVPS